MIFRKLSFKIVFRKVIDSAIQFQLYIFFRETKLIWLMNYSLAKIDLSKSFRLDTIAYDFVAK